MEVRVRIIEDRRIEVSTFGPFAVKKGSDLIEKQEDGNHSTYVFNYPLSNEVQFIPQSSESYFIIKNVRIGINFHWGKNESQCFKGELIIREKAAGKEEFLEAINIIDLEEYLKSVISSEMNPEAPTEFLKAHAIISRSWIVARINGINNTTSSEGYKINNNERILWYDNDGHEDFDVCADDHCQRYQGVSVITRQAADAVESTKGLILEYDGEICDARFSKCCGGAFERFENCWSNSPKPYLKEGRDILPFKSIPPLSSEEEATKWINNDPPSFCNIKDSQIINRILKNYDQSTTFYRWKIKYSQSELREIIKEKTGYDFGIIKDLVPLKRGKSGRIIELKIIGSEKELIIGKELEIRRVLSKSHLYSSAFIVEIQDTDMNGDPDTFVIKGAGWGHGVGLCQTGAAMMALLGYDYEKILSHYYPATKINPIAKME